MTGTPPQVRESLRRAASAFTRDVAGFKIGRTNDPDRRKFAYRGYDEVVVIYQTSSEPFTDEVERDLIDFFKDHADNFRGGGGGPMGDGPHYVYVVIER